MTLEEIRRILDAEVIGGKGTTLTVRIAIENGAGRETHRTDS